MRFRSAGIVAGLALLAATAFGAGAPAVGRSGAATSHGGKLAPLARHLSRRWQAPPTTADCVAQAGIPCYAPFQLQRAYDLNALYRKGLAGRAWTAAAGRS